MEGLGARLSFRSTQLPLPKVNRLCILLSCKQLCVPHNRYLLTCLFASGIRNTTNSRTGIIPPVFSQECKFSLIQGAGIRPTFVVTNHGLTQYTSIEERLYSLAVCCEGLFVPRTFREVSGYGGKPGCSLTVLQKKGHSPDRQQKAKQLPRDSVRNIWSWSCTQARSSIIHFDFFSVCTCGPLCPKNVAHKCEEAMKR